MGFLGSVAGEEKGVRRVGSTCSRNEVARKVVELSKCESQLTKNKKERKKGRVHHLREV